MELPLRPAAAVLLLLAAGASPPADRGAPQRYAQAIFHQRIIVRVPGRTGEAVRSTPQIRWKEKKGPKCIPTRAIAGAALISQNSVDLILRDRRRLRAKLENSCPALDYYYGFYIMPNPDGQVCADRDVIRSRMGGQCKIDKFRSLEPQPRD